MNEEFFKTIEPILIKLRDKIGDDFIVFGSALLYLLGVVEFDGAINDLDITVRDVSIIPDEAAEITFHKEQKLYQLKIDGIKVDIGTLWPGFEKYFKKIFEDPILYKGFKFANIDIVEDWKIEMVRLYDRQKDKEYLKKIKDYRATIFNI
jgi:hypothetical protein